VYVNVCMIDASWEFWASVPLMLGSEFVLRMHGVASGATCLAAGVMDFFKNFDAMVLFLGQEAENKVLGARLVAAHAVGTP